MAQFASLSLNVSLGMVISGKGPSERTGTKNLLVWDPVMCKQEYQRAQQSSTHARSCATHGAFLLAYDSYTVVGLIRSGAGGNAVGNPIHFG